MAEYKDFDRFMRYEHLIEHETGRVPQRTFHEDGYKNLLTKYGTDKDSTEYYQYEAEPTIPDETIEGFYESNGLFARIIDAPAEEAVKHGFELEGVKSQETVRYYENMLDSLDWEDVFTTSIKWARLFGGALAVMLVDDGRGLDEPLNWDGIQSIDNIRVYDRTQIQPVRNANLNQSSARDSALGMPEYYQVFSRYGNFTVHESRCLIFQNGILPEKATNSLYQMWGEPEFVRINKAVRDVDICHGYIPRLLDRSVQAVYKMRDLAAELATEEGEDRVLRRLQTIDMARGLLNSITIDSEGEDYDFKQFTYTGIADTVNLTCNYLSALTCIPQTVLFGKEPAGLDATGHSDMENWYNYIERIQKRMLKSNLRYLLRIIFKVGEYEGKIDKTPAIHIKFQPLWSLSEEQKANLEATKASTQQTRAATVAQYMELQVISNLEVRRALASEEEFDVESMLDGLDVYDLAMGQKEIEEFAGQQAAQGGGEPQGGGMPMGEEIAQGMPQVGGKAKQKSPVAKEKNEDEESLQPYRTSESGKTVIATKNDHSVGIVVVQGGKILVARREDGNGKGKFGGPGGHMEIGEYPLQAAIRETIEEFDIMPTSMEYIGEGIKEIGTGLTPYVYLCTEFSGVPKCKDGEMSKPDFLSIEDIEADKGNMFPPFYRAVEMVKSYLETFIKSEEPEIRQKAELVETTKHDIALEHEGKMFIDEAVAKEIASEQAYTAEHSQYKFADFSEDVNKTLDISEKDDIIQDIHEDSKSTKKKSKEEKHPKYQQLNGQKGNWVTINGNHIFVTLGGMFMNAGMKEPCTAEEYWEMKTAEQEENERTAAEEERIKKIEEQERFRKDKRNREAPEKKEVSATGKNESCGGFAVEEVNGQEKDKLEEHYRYHVLSCKEPAFDGMTQDEYDKYADDFLQAEVGGDIKGFSFSSVLDGKTVHGICRFNAKTGVFAMGYPGYKVSTCFVAKYYDKVNKSVNENYIEMANAYYEKVLGDTESGVIRERRILK